MIDSNVWAILYLSLSTRIFTCCQCEPVRCDPGPNTCCCLCRLPKTPKSTGCHMLSGVKEGCMIWLSLRISTREYHPLIKRLMLNHSSKQLLSYRTVILKKPIKFCCTQVDRLVRIKAKRIRMLQTHSYCTSL